MSAEAGPFLNDVTNNLGYSPNAQAQRQAELFHALRQIVPEVISDNQLDLEKLKTLLGDERLAPTEHYELSWAGKAAARREIQKSTSHTLHPAANNPEHAPHMLIEGENLEVLRVLQKSYYGKVKMIYIDPPYNTGNDSFVYPDDYSETLDEYQKRTGEKNAEGYLNKQSLWKKNSKESGQYHSAWLSMMYPRLYLARNLLRDDGVIFISIDDNEAANLKLLCDEVFGAENFVANILWQKKYAAANDHKSIAPLHDHILVYSKSEKWQRNLLERTDEMDKQYRFVDEKGTFRTDNYLCNKSADERPNLYYPIIQPNTGEEVWPKRTAVWRYSKETHLFNVSNDLVYWGKDGLGKVPAFKRYKHLLKNDGKTIPTTWWTFEECGHNDEAQRETASILMAKIFSTPKPIRLLEKILKLSTNTDSSDLVLDFFAGSGTTAQAVMELNLEDGGNRQCICVQLPEVLEENSEAYKAGYRTIADITRARIDKVIAKLKAEHPDKTTDLACAQFTLAPSNFKVWRSESDNLEALNDQLVLFQQMEKYSSQTTCAELHSGKLAELLLKFGLGALGVQAAVQTLNIASISVYCAPLPDNKTLWLCFEPYAPALKEAIAQARPTQVLLLNSCFVGNQADEQLANLQLELKGLDIGLTVI
jgi:adenine-specific DNA-methyltransferase